MARESHYKRPAIEQSHNEARARSGEGSSSGQPAPILQICWSSRKDRGLPLLDPK